MIKPPLSRSPLFLLGLLGVAVYGVVALEIWAADDEDATPAAGPAPAAPALAVAPFAVVEGVDDTAPSWPREAPAPAAEAHGVTVAA